MERRSDGVEVRSIDAHLVEHLGVHDVEAAAPIHLYLGEPLWTDDRIDDERVLPGCGMASGWSVRSKVMADSDHRRKASVAGLAV